MKISGGLKENGIFVGNTYDKYGSSNPVVRWIMRGFDETLAALVHTAGPTTIHEIGCGEGYWVLHWRSQGVTARGSDFSARVIELARANARTHDVAPEAFRVRGIHDVQPGEDSADLVVCCEVLEHLENPETALAALRKIVTKDLIISVPREPLWRALNLARGKYVGDLGNTPGHLQHWSTRSLVRLVEQYFDVREVRTPLPWTMLLCRARR